MIDSWSSEHPRTFPAVSLPIRAGVLVGMLLILGSFWSAEFAHAQDTETQQLSLEQGKNVISLRVQPADASLASIFEGHLDQISWIKDEVGRVYIPDEGIKQLTTWDANEGYKVYATSSFDVEVTGAPLSLTTTTVPLEKGGNLIPYLPAEPQAVDEGLVSISNTLVRVEDGAGNAYEPDDSPSSLDSLRTGKGYVLYVDQPDTLVYTIQTATLANALNLEGTQVGQHVRVQGRDESGDGGGGIFVVTNSGARMDGGTVFAFEEDLTEVTEEVNTDRFNQSANPVDLPNTNLEWRDFKIAYGPDPEDEITIRRLHGHHSSNSSSSDDVVDLQAGVVGHDIFPSKLWRQEWGYSTTRYDVTYKYATSDRRLERKNVGNNVNLAWWGAPTADPNNPVVADNEIAWAINVANRIYKDNTFDWVHVDIPGEYYYRDYFEMMTGVKLRGVGSLNADGFTKGTITWMPGEIMFHRLSDYSWDTDPDRKRAYAKVGRHKAVIGHEGGIKKTGFEAMKFDGNVPNNMQVFNNLGDYDAPENWLQNSGSWSAFYAVNFFDDNFEVDLENIHVKDMGGSGLPAAQNTNGQAATYTTSGQILLDTARRNHLFYGLSGTIDGVTLKGHYWGGNPLSAGAGAGSGDATYTNLTVKDLEENPQFLMGGMLTDRRGGILIDGFTIDLETSVIGASGAFVLLTADDQGTKLKNGTIDTPKPENSNTGVVQLLRQRQRSQDFADENPMRFENIDVTDHGVPIMLANGIARSRIQDLVLKDITVSLADGVSGTENNALMKMRQDEGLGQYLEKARRIKMDNVSYQRPLDEEFRSTLIDFGNSKDSGEAFPFDIFVVDSDFENEGNKIVDFQFRSDEKWAETDVYFDNVTHPVMQQWAMNPTKSTYAVRLRNSQDGNGRVSDNSGTYTSDAGDEGNDYVLIPTDLMSNAWERSATVTSGAPNVTSIDIANADGSLRSDLEQTDPYLKVNFDQPIGNGETIDVEWEARVTPLDDYQTTGLFIARDVSDKNFSSGNGPWTVDLRGVASSQESREKITYTASSDDTSTVTANVQSDEYTLELTEQGTGTATITVTGEIEGVGTTTETFAVSIP